MTSIALVYGTIVFNFIAYRLLPKQPVGIYIDPWDFIDYPPPLSESDLPLLYEFGIFALNMLTFQFGHSFREGFRPVIELIVLRLPNTLLLMGAAAVLSIALGIATGILSGSKRRGKLDVGMVTTALAFRSIPTFWLGMMLILFLGFCIPLSPTAYTIISPTPRGPVTYGLDVARHLVLPATSLALGSYGGYMLAMRNSLIDVLSEDYVVTARAKGIDERTVLCRHALPNALLPLTTTIALTFGFLLSGATLTETVFNWYGLGRLIYEAAIWRNSPVLQAVFYIMALIVIVANSIVDTLYGFLNPRIRQD